MTKEQLVKNIKDKKSLLCVGLDTDIQKIPEIFKKDKDPVFAFNKMVIEQTADYAVAYKPNLAFYEYSRNVCQNLFRMVKLRFGNPFSIHGKGFYYSFFKV